jgi:DNA-binding transcriptional LysR family regulator
MNPQQLRYLVAAADTGSLSGAARSNHVSQPAVSRALHDLEREFDLQLFRRDGRRLVLTDTGALVANAAREALGAFENVERLARRAATRELRLVATPTNSVLLGPISAHFLKQHPHVALRLLRANDMQDVAKAVAGGDADLGFGDIDGFDDPRCRCEPLWTVEVVLVSPSGLDLPQTIPVADLADQALVLPTGQSQRRKMIDDLVSEAAGRLPQQTLATDERSAWSSSARFGIASFISYRTVAAELDDVELRALDPSLDTTVGFVIGRDLSRDAAAFIAMARADPAPPGCHDPRAA